MLLMLLQSSTLNPIKSPKHEFENRAETQSTFPLLFPVFRNLINKTRNGFLTNSEKPKFYASGG